jgi:hypothetical protein
MWLCDSSPDGVQRTRESHYDDNLRNHDNLRNNDRWEPVASIVFLGGQPYPPKRYCRDKRMGPHAGL